MKPCAFHPRLLTTAVFMLALATVPAVGQMIVYDPSNYAQNVLQAARALQQINNQVTSLQNQTQMLLNQARNLTSLPYSSLAGDRPVDSAHPAAAQSGPTYLLRHQSDRPSVSAFISAKLSCFDVIAAAHR